MLYFGLSEIKLNLSLSAPRRHTGGEEVQLHSFLTTTLDGGEWSVSQPDRFTAGKKSRYLLKKRLGEAHRRSGPFW